MYNGQAMRDRLQRLADWDPLVSLGASRLSVEDPGLGQQTLRYLAIVESLYPPGEAGQIILAEDADPMAVDDLIVGSPRVDQAAIAYETTRPFGYAEWISERPGPPVRQLFGVRADASWANKPAGALFTSLAAGGELSMWRAHVAASGWELGSRWRLSSDAHSEKEIDSATEWCTFALHYSGATGHIDWLAVCADFDAIRITPRAIVAIDCFAFRFRGKQIAPVWWGAETTVWLRWVFASASGV